MATLNNHMKHNKNIPAILAAFGMTFLIGLVMVIIGLNALVNKNVTPVQAANPTDQAVNADQATIDRLQSQIATYQAREQQYQTELSQAADQLNQANAQLAQADSTLQQYQGLITALQNANVIQITPDGQVLIPRSRFGNGGDD